MHISLTFLLKYPQDFEIRKKLLAERTTQKHSAPKKLASIDKDLDAFPFLKVCWCLKYHYMGVKQMIVIL